MVGRGSSRPSSPWGRRLAALLLPLFLLVGSLAGPLWALAEGTGIPARPLALRQVPGPSPRQTIDNFLAITDQAHQLIQGAIRQGLADPAWDYSPEQRQQVALGQGLLAQATEALNLSELPQALHPITGVGTMVMLRSLLLYDLANHPNLELPGPDDVARHKLQSWTIPETPITLARNQPTKGSKDGAAVLPCQQCSDQDFLFSPRTVAQVDADFNRIFNADPVLRHRFGGDLYVTWSLLPGGALPPKGLLRLPAPWKHWLVNQLYGGQSLLQWLILVPSSAGVLALGLGLLQRLRQQLRLSLDHLGRRPHWQRVGLLLPLLPLVSLWRWFCIDWVNLTGDRALVVLVTARVLNIALAMPFLYLVAEAVGQSLIRKRQRSADGSVVLVRRKGAGQLLTIIRVIGLAAAVTVLVQGARSLGLTSVTILALSSVPALAISLGTQQLIRDISDGFSLFLDGQLKVGDKCTIGTPKSGKIDGTVVSMGMRSISLRLRNGSQLSMPNSQVAESVVTNHSLRSAEPLELRLSIPKLETQALADLQIRAQVLLSHTKDLASADVHLDHGDGEWWLHVQGRWSPQLASADLPQRRDGLFLALHSLITSLGSEAGAPAG